MRIAIVDDNRDDALALRDCVAACAQDDAAPGEAEVELFAGGEEFLRGRPSGLDVAFIDVQMPGLGGVETARRLREEDGRVCIVFVTSYFQYALEGYAVGALDFILKPVGRPSVAACLDRARRQLERASKHVIAVQNGRETCYLDVAGIDLVETSGKHVVVRGSFGSVPSTETMKELERRLSGFGFYRCHQAYLINMAKIDTVRGDCAVVAGTSVPISRHRRAAFLDALAAYVGGVL